MRKSFFLQIIWNHNRNNSSYKWIWISKRFRIYFQENAQFFMLKLIFSLNFCQVFLVKKRNFFPQWIGWFSKKSIESDKLCLFSENSVFSFFFLHLFQYKVFYFRNYAKLNKNLQEIMPKINSLFFFHKSHSIGERQLLID